MLKINQTYVKLEDGWLPATTYIINQETGTGPIRTYRGAYYPNGTPRKTVSWESDNEPTLDEIMEKGPQPALDIRELDRKEREIKPVAPTYVPMPPPVQVIDESVGFPSVTMVAVFIVIVTLFALLILEVVPCASPI